MINVKNTLLLLAGAIVAALAANTKLASDDAADKAAITQGKTDLDLANAKIADLQAHLAENNIDLTDEEQAQIDAALQAALAATPAEVPAAEPAKIEDTEVAPTEAAQPASVS